MSEQDTPLISHCIICGKNKFTGPLASQLLPPFISLCGGPDFFSQQSTVNLSMHMLDSSSVSCSSMFRSLFFPFTLLIFFVPVLLVDQSEKLRRANGREGRSKSEGKGSNPLSTRARSSPFGCVPSFHSLSFFLTCVLPHLSPRFLGASW